MKSQEEYLDEVHFHKNIRNTLSQILSPDGIDNNMHERLLKAFDLIQKDAYNQAIQDMFEYQLLNGCLETNENIVNKLKIK